jgi:outer membrane lipoprotein carrier protein
MSRAVVDESRKGTYGSLALKKLLTFGLLFLLAGVARAESDPDAVVNRLQKSYDSIRTIEATFDQTYRSLRFDPKQSGGTVVISKPGKMRWDYLNPKGRVMVSDGKRFTLYDPDDRQALIADQPKEEGLPLAVSFLAGRGRLKEMFRIRIETNARAAPDEVVLRCIPLRPEPNVAEVYLTVRTTDPVLVTSSRIVDSLGGENEIRFTDLRVNRPVADALFAFHPPQGTPVVSMPSVEPRM